MRYLIGIILFACTTIHAQVNHVLEREIPTTLKGNPGNIFLEGQVVKVTLPDNIRWECLDYDRNTVMQGEGPVADLRKLSVGYYEIVPHGKKNLGPGELAPWPVTIGVIAPLQAPTPLNSPIAVDASLSGFYGDGDNTKALEIGSNQAALAGINWIRDRVSWQDTHLGPGEFSNLNEYDHGARIQAEAGLRVLQVPYPRTTSWIETDGDNRFPIDLRYAYEYYLEMSARWKDYVEAWEPWNEPEWVAFGGHTGAEIASLQKACYWAIRKGNPDAKVSLIALTGEYFDHLHNFADNEVWPYFDTFNYHQYFNLFEGEATMSLLRSIAAGRPEWITETGIELRWNGPFEEGELTWNDQLRQARHVPKVFAVNIHRGIDAVYFFLLPHYRERENQFGITRKDYTPRPSYLALAAAGRILAGAEPLGELIDSSRQHLKDFHFATKTNGKDHEVTVLWSEGPTEEYSIPNYEKLISVHDLTGRSLEMMKDHISVGSDAIYLIYNPGVSAELGLTPPPEPGIFQTGDPCPLVMQPVPHPAQKVIGTSDYMFKPHEEVSFPIVLYNFSEKPILTNLSIDPNAHFNISIEQHKFTVASMDRIEVNLTVLPGNPSNSLQPQIIKIHADCGEFGKQLLAMRFAHSPNTIEPLEHIAISSTEGAYRWNTASRSGDLQVQPAEEGGIRLSAISADKGNYIRASVEVPVNQRAMAKTQGLAFTVKPLEGIGRYEVNFRESSGRSYWGYVFVPDKDQLGDTKHFVLRFETLEETTSPKPGKLRPIDPQKIVFVQVGCYTTEEKLTFEVRNLAWVRYE